MYFLEKFLNSCVANEEFKSNKFLYFFLNLEDENQFKVKRKVSEVIYGKRWLICIKGRRRFTQGC